MSKLIKFISPVPMGMKIFAHGVEVVIPHNRRRTARKFANGKKRRIYLHYGRNDEHASDAIGVIGKSRGWFLERQKHIGYIPLNMAGRLATVGMNGKVRARLHMITIEDDASVTIRLNLLGPTDDYESFFSRD